MLTDLNKIASIFIISMVCVSEKIRNPFVSTITVSKIEDNSIRSYFPSTTIVSLILGVVGTLIFGTGMCCCLVWNQFILGVFVGIVGLVGVSLAYPAYTYITKKEKERLTPEILRLTEELLQ